MQSAKGGTAQWGRERLSASLGALRKLLDLRGDQDRLSVIDESIRAGARASGTNLWVLIFAILVASVGLNVNSTAVIIGAMLISPLMGPLLALGYGAGIDDVGLMRQGLRSLAAFVAISLVTSTIYFAISPLSQAQSELFARTRPTLWDVLIAFFGGCAGIIAQTRRGTSTVIPGVAIATALMPPLCTVGFGLASMDWDFALGAMYLFTINAFFIALATYGFVKLLRFPTHVEADEKVQRRIRAIIAVGVIAMILPSGYLGYRLVQEQLFVSAAATLVAELRKSDKSVLLASDVSGPARRLTLTFGGAAPRSDLARELQARLSDRGFPDARLVIRQIGAEKIDTVALKSELQRDVLNETFGKLAQSNARIEELNAELAKAHAAKESVDELTREIAVQYPAIRLVSVAEGGQSVRGRADVVPALLVAIEASPPLGADDVRRIEAWMRERFPDRAVRIAQDDRRQAAVAVRNRPSRGADAAPRPSK